MKAQSGLAIRDFAGEFLLFVLGGTVTETWANFPATPKISGAKGPLLSHLSLRLAQSEAQWACWAGLKTKQKSKPKAESLKRIH